MVESEKDLELGSAMPVSVPEHETRENNVTLDSDGIVLLCSVCGALAEGLYYGVLSCWACATFYRQRTIPGRLPPLPCINNEQCSISTINRNSCSHCRLKKCIAVGMSKHLGTGRSSQEEDRLTAECSVCGDVAKGLYYGVLSCISCATFFKHRSKPGKLEPLPCKNNKQCSISPINLKSCPECRLKKCIAAGMTKDHRTSLPRSDDKYRLPYVSEQ